MTGYAAKVTSKGQVTIPKAIREKYELADGDFLIFDPQEDLFVVRKGQVVSHEAAEQEFDALLDNMARHFEERGITRDDIEEAVRWAREN